MSNLKIEKLQQEGKLQKGDLISTAEHGKCTVQFIESLGSIVVRPVVGKMIRLTGINFGCQTVLARS